LFVPLPRAYTSRGLQAVHDLREAATTRTQANPIAFSNDTSTSRFHSVPREHHESKTFRGDCIEAQTWTTGSDGMMKNDHTDENDDR
jgi:hypothetical protein